MMGRVTIDRRRIAAYEKMSSDNKAHLNSFGFASLSNLDAVIKLFLKTTAKVILLMPYLMNSVGIIHFMMIIVLIGTLGFIKIQILLYTSKKEGYYNYGLLLRKAFGTNIFFIVTIVESLSYLVEYGFIIIQVTWFWINDFRSFRF